jgi:hypothetical protein
MRNQAPEDFTYIVNVATQIVGQRPLSALGPTIKRADLPASVSILGPLLEPRLKEMNDETLGRICSHGNHNGWHCGMATTPSPAFINKTGFCNLLLPGHTIQYNRHTGREILEDVALLTLVCIIQDFLRQHDLQMKWQEEYEAHQLERAEHAMIHPNRHSH